MPGIVALVNAISADVVAGLAAAGYPPLVDGKIVIGRQHQFDESAPPKIIFIPMGSTFGPKSVSSALPLASNQPYSAERMAQIQQRAVATDLIEFEVQCWGQSATADPDLDFDTTQALYQQVFISVHRLCTGIYAFTNGAFVDSELDAPQQVRAGRLHVMRLSIQTPILDTLLPVAPTNTRQVPTTRLASADGTTTDTGCSG